VTPPPGPGGPPTIENETTVSPGARAWEVDVHVYTDTPVFIYGNRDGVVPPLPTDTDIRIHSTFMCYVDGIITEPGDLASLEGSGSIPLEFDGNLLLSGAVLVDDDLFS
jgi:hypothetical protein